MARLPIPGGDDGTWGDILNSFLEVSLASDGSLKGNVVGTAQLQNNSVTNVQLDPSTQAIIASVASKYVKPAGGIPSSDLSSGVQSSLTSGSSSVQSVNGKTGSSISLSASDVGAPTTLAGQGDVSISGPSNSQGLIYNSGTGKWTNQVLPSAPVSSVAGKTGAVTLVEGDIASLTTDLGATEKTANKDAANGYAGLDANTLLKVVELPRAAGSVTALGSVSGAVNCDLSLTIAFTATLTGNTTFTFINWPASGLVEPELYTLQDSSGGHTISITGVAWEPTGSPPTFSTAPNAVNIIPLASFNGGLNINGLTGLQGPIGLTGVGPGNTFSMPGALAVTVGASRQYLERSYTITNVRASVGTAPTGSSIICDVLKNGTTIYTTTGNRPTIAVNTNTATANNPDITSISAGDYLTVNVAQIGSTTAGADLTVSIVVQ